MRAIKILRCLKINLVKIFTKSYQSFLKNVEDMEKYSVFYI
jgi:hypothetical protein